MNTLRRHRLPVDIISYALEVYCRLKPSHRDVENLLGERGIVVIVIVIVISGEVRPWRIEFGAVYACLLKRSARRK